MSKCTLGGGGEVTYAYPEVGGDQGLSAAPV